MKLIQIFIFGSIVCIYSIANSQNKIETTVQTGHYAVINTVAFSPDSKFALTGSDDKTIKLWEVSSGKEIRSFLGHKSGINHIKFNKEGDKLLSISHDGELIIWLVNTSKKLLSKKLVNDKIISACFSSGMNYFATGAKKSGITIWDAATGDSIKSFQVEGDLKNYYKSVSSIQFNNDGTKIIAACNDRTIFIWDIKTGKQVKKFKNSRYSCSSCTVETQLSQDEKFIAIGDSDSLRIMDINSGKIIKTMKDVKGRFSSLSFSSNGNTIAAIVYNKAYLWNVNTAKLLREFKSENHRFTCVSISYDNKYVLIGNQNRTASIWDLKNGNEIITLKGYLNDINPIILNDSYMYWVALINQVKISPDGKMIAIGKTGNNVKILDLETNRIIYTLRGHQEMVVCLDYSPDSKMLVTGSVDGSIKIWDLETGKEKRSFNKNQTIIFDVAFSNNGQYIISGDWSGYIDIFEAITGTRIQTFYPHDGRAIFKVDFSNNDLYVISSGLDRKLCMLEIDTKQEIRNFIGHTNVVSSMDFSKDGKTLMTGSWDGKVKLWDIASGLQINKFHLHEGGVYDAKFDPTGKYIISGGEDNMAKYTEIETGNVIQSFVGHKGAVGAVNLTLDNKFFITGSRDGTIKTWELSTGKEIITHIFIGDDDWMVKTPEGYFDASERAKKSIFFVKGTEIYNIDQFFNDFYKPGLYNQIINNRGDLNQNINIIDKIISSPPPEVQIVSPENNEEFEKKDIYLLANFINTGDGINEIILLQNGKRIPVDASDVQRMKKAGQNYLKTINLSLIPGDNTITVSAINNGNVESKPATISIQYKGEAKTANCYLVAVGINKYENERLNLNYAKADAESFAEIIETHGKKLFKNIEISVLYDKNATKENIENLLISLSEKVTKEDVFIFYYAGHGSVVDNNFYFIPTDNVSLYQPEKLKKEAIYAGNLQEKFKNIKALKQIVIIDACHSGSSTQILAQRGASEEKALAQMSRSSGVHVLASAGSEQQAAEVGSIGHGVFTYVLLEALNGSADGAPKDGKITIYELKSYLDDQVPEISKKFIGHKQYPTTFSSGHDFPIVFK